MWRLRGILITFHYTDFKLNLLRPTGLLKVAGTRVNTPIGNTVFFSSHSSSLQQGLPAYNWLESSMSPPPLNHNSVSPDLIAWQKVGQILSGIVAKMGNLIWWHTGVSNLHYVGQHSRTLTASHCARAQLVHRLGIPVCDQIEDVYWLLLFLVVLHWQIISTIYMCTYILYRVSTTKVSLLLKVQHGTCMYSKHRPGREMSGDRV